MTYYQTMHPSQVQSEAGALLQTGSFITVSSGSCMALEMVACLRADLITVHTGLCSKEPHENSIIDLIFTDLAVYLAVYLAV